MSQPLNNNTDQKNLIYNLNKNYEFQQRAQRANTLSIALLAYCAVSDVTSCNHCLTKDVENSCSTKCNASATFLMLIFTALTQVLSEVFVNRDLKNRKINQI